MPKVLKTTETPNPSARRFYLDTPIWGTGSRDFPNVESAQDHPLAAKLFEIPDVAAIFFLNGTITVTKDSDREWGELISPIADCIESRESWGKPGDEEVSAKPHRHAISDSHAYFELSEVQKREKIQSILDVDIRPGLQGDGGDLELVGCDDHNVIVRYAGACGTCPTSGTGTLSFIEKMMRDKVHPGIKVHQA